MYLLIKNFKNRKPSKKLDQKYIGLFLIKKILLLKINYQL